MSVALNLGGPWIDIQPGTCRFFNDAQVIKSNAKIMYSEKYVFVLLANSSFIIIVSFETMKPKLLKRPPEINQFI
jgi:hypothetical protein